ncbi:MAG: aminodeoxychorismate/anthranilate synthase component II [Candidatus Diapherotrites archaeon]|nr:aminodeoxychorismate/anthranilate synthase component II [Candidatus Diapherotrites archaeon]
MKILLIDNFDSFVYNLYQYLSELGNQVIVVRNNEITLSEIQKQHFARIVISPGPGTPTNQTDFGICMKVIKQLGKTIPVLGICLGHQGIISAFGGNIIRAQKPLHGKISQIKHTESDLFKGIKNPLNVMRYHSLIGEKESLPNCLKITAFSLDDSAIMGIQHSVYPIYGVQFHPESILTQDGKKILANFCNLKVMK